MPESIRTAPIRTAQPREDPRERLVRPARGGGQTSTENLTGSAVARLGLAGGNNPRHNLDVSVMDSDIILASEAPGQPADRNYGLQSSNLSSTNRSRTMILAIV